MLSGLSSQVGMAAELNAFKKNPLAAVEVAVGDPFPKLISQKKGSIYIDQFYKKENTRFILKKARFSRDDVRVFDSNGNVALVSHHPGKNPYESLDPLGLANTDAVFSPLGEWESLCNITSYSSQLSSLEIRPKTLTSTFAQPCLYSLCV